MIENWRDIPGYEGRYQISDLGRVKSLSFMQRYLKRNHEPNFRRTKEKIIGQHQQNCGYLLVWLWLNGKQQTLSVHRLVARAFVAGTGETVNHKNGDKTDNRATNLEWLSYSENHLHAVATGLNKQARRVQNPATGVVYPSIKQAAAACGMAHRTVRKTFRRVP
jgi:hypothetical protein